MEVLCIDGNFSKETLEFYKIYGVITPIQDKIYNIREVINHASKPSGGETIGVRLEEIINPKVPIETSLLGKTMIEPSFALYRFRRLDGSILTKKEVENIKQKV